MKTTKKAGIAILLGLLAIGAYKAFATKKADSPGDNNNDDKPKDPDELEKPQDVEPGGGAGGDDIVEYNTGVVGPQPGSGDNTAADGKRNRELAGFYRLIN